MVEHIIDTATRVVAPKNRKLSERIITLERRAKARKKLSHSARKSLDKVRPAKPLPHEAYMQFMRTDEIDMPDTLEYGKLYKVSQFNLKKMQRPLGEFRFAQLAEASDIFMMQEFVSESNYLKTLHNSGHTGRMSIHFFPRDTVATGVATFSKIRPSKQIYLISQDREVGWRSYKSAVCTFYALGKQESSSQRFAIIVNIHGFNFGSKHGLGRQLDRLEEILSPFKGTYPIIVGGDFNTWNVGRLGLFSQFVSVLDLRTVFLGNTVSTGFGIPLDWVCISSGVDISNMQVVKNNLYSDHASIEYEFAIKGDSLSV